MKRRMTRWQLEVLVATGIFPALRLLSGLIRWLLGSAIFTSAYAGNYLLLPLLTLAALYLIIHGSKDTTDLVVFTSIVLCSFLIFTMIFRYQCTFPTHEVHTGDAALSTYETYTDWSESMPSVEDLGLPDSVEFHYYTNLSAAHIGSESSTIICTYSREVHTAMAAEQSPSYEPLCTLDGFEFRYRKDSEYTVLLLGINTETCEILWSRCSGDGLDYSSDPESFLLEDCGWKFIR